MKIDISYNEKKEMRQSDSPYYPGSTETISELNLFLRGAPEIVKKVRQAIMNVIEEKV